MANSGKVANSKKNIRYQSSQRVKRKAPKLKREKLKKFTTTIELSFLEEQSWSTQCGLWTTTPEKDCEKEHGSTNKEDVTAHSPVIIFPRSVVLIILSSSSQMARTSSSSLDQVLIILSPHFPPSSSSLRLCSIDSFIPIVFICPSLALISPPEPSHPQFPPPSSLV